MDQEYFTIKEAADLLGVSAITLRNWDKKGLLIAYRHPFNNYRIYKADQIELLKRKMEGSRQKLLKRKMDVV